VKVYRQLIDASAAVVVDTRIAAVAKEPVLEEIRPLLEGMLAINGDGRLMREIWLSSAMLANSAVRYNLAMGPTLLHVTR